MCEIYDGLTHASRVEFHRAAYENRQQDAMEAAEWLEKHPQCPGFLQDSQIRLIFAAYASANKHREALRELETA